MRVARGVHVVADNLAIIVDSVGRCGCGVRIIDAGEAAVGTAKEAVHFARAVLPLPHDLPRVVDGVCRC